MKNKLFIDLLPLETERLFIRPTGEEDIELILKMDKQETTQEFLGGIKNKTREERIEFLKRKKKKFEDGLAGSLTICLKDGTPIGFTGLSIDESNNEAEISYIFDADYTKKGYCFEACKKLIDTAFNSLELHRIFADTIEGNNGSKKVLEKLGFVLEGTRREAAYIKEKDEYKDFLDYGLLRDEYK